MTHYKLQQGDAIDLQQQQQQQQNLIKKGVRNLFTCYFIGKHRKTTLSTEKVSEGRFYCNSLLVLIAFC